MAGCELPALLASWMRFQITLPFRSGRKCCGGRSSFQTILGSRSARPRPRRPPGGLAPPPGGPPPRGGGKTVGCPACQGAGGGHCARLVRDCDAGSPTGWYGSDHCAPAQDCPDRARSLDQTGCADASSLSMQRLLARLPTTVANIRGVNMAKRRTFTAAFKARVAKEALRGDKTVRDEREAEIRKLHEKIGQLVIERDFLPIEEGFFACQRGRRAQECGRRTRDRAGWQRICWGKPLAGTSAMANARIPEGASRGTRELGSSADRAHAVRMRVPGPAGLAVEGADGLRERAREGAGGRRDAPTSHARRAAPAAAGRRGPGRPPAAGPQGTAQRPSGADLGRVPPPALHPAPGGGRTAPRSRARPPRSRPSAAAAPPAGHHRRPAQLPPRAPPAVPTRILRCAGRLPARAHRAPLSGPLPATDSLAIPWPATRRAAQSAGCGPHTNKVIQHFFGAAKQGLRRRVGRAYLGRDLEDHPAQAALTANLRHPDYVHILCGTLDRLPQAFAQLDGQPCTGPPRLAHV